MWSSSDVNFRSMSWLSINSTHWVVGGIVGVDVCSGGGGEGLVNGLQVANQYGFDEGKYYVVLASG
jgi:hypothetical protein